MLNGAEVFFEEHGREIEANWQLQKSYEQGVKLIEAVSDQLMSIWVAERKRLLAVNFGLKLESLHQHHGEEGTNVIESYTFNVGHACSNKGRTQPIGKLTLYRTDGENPYPCIKLTTDGAELAAHTFEGRLTVRAVVDEMAGHMQLMMKRIPGMFGMKALPEEPAEKQDWNTRAAEFHEGMQAVVASFNKANADEKTSVRMQIEPISGKEPFCAKAYSVTVSQGRNQPQEIMVYGAMMHGAIGFQTRPGSYVRTGPITKYAQADQGIPTTRQMESLWREVAKAFHPLMRSHGFRQQGRDMPLVYG